MRFLSAFLLVLVSLTRVRAGLLNAGPYDLKLDRHELCEDMGTGETPSDWSMVKKSTHKMFLHGPIYLPFDYDDTMQIWFPRLGEKAYHSIDKPFCSKFKSNVPEIFDFFFKSWGVENPSCPIKSGNYTMDLDTDLPRLSTLPLLPYGRYKIVHSLYRGNPPVKFSCSIFYMTCSERPR